MLLLWRVILYPWPISSLDQTQSTHIQAITGWMFFLLLHKQMQREVFYNFFIYVYLVLPFWFSFRQDLCVINCHNLTPNLAAYSSVFQGISHAVKCLWFYYRIRILDSEYYAVLRQVRCLGLWFSFKSISKYYYPKRGACLS